MILVMGLVKQFSLGGLQIIVAAINDRFINAYRFITSPPPVEAKIWLSPAKGLSDPIIRRLQQDHINVTPSESAMITTVRVDNVQALKEELKRIERLAEDQETSETHIYLTHITLPRAQIADLLVVLRLLLYVFVFAMGIVFSLSFLQVLPIRTEIGGIGIFLGVLFLFGIHVESIYWDKDREPISGPIEKFTTRGP